MAENKEIIEKLVELIEIYLENAQMNEVSTDWQEGDIDFEEVLDIVVTDGLYDLNFTEEQTNEFLALYKALNQKQVSIDEAKLDKETKKGDNTMEKEVKSMEEVKNPSDKIFDERARAIIYNAIVLLQEYAGEDFEDMEFLLGELGITSPAEVKEVKLMMNEGMKKPVMESKKPVKEGIRLIYNPREKTEVKEKVEVSFDGEPLPVDIKESNTHHKLRLFKIK
jgi:hypothetical protein